MTGQEVRSAYPNQWLVLEAIGAHKEENRRSVDQIAVVETSAPDKLPSWKAWLSDFSFIH
jgi:hypothetical protein